MLNCTSIMRGCLERRNRLIIKVSYIEYIYIYIFLAKDERVERQKLKKEEHQNEKRMQCKVIQKVESRKKELSQSQTVKKAERRRKGKAVKG
jgi:hypothetical protein